MSLLVYATISTAVIPTEAFRSRKRTKCEVEEPAVGVLACDEQDKAHEIEAAYSRSKLRAKSQ